MILYLPGYSAKNKVEQQIMSKAFTSEGYEVFLHEWKHWSDESIDLNIEDEMELISQAIQGKSIEAIVAKSIGTYVAARLIWSRLIDPQKIILLGIPLNDLDRDEKELMQLSLRRVQGKSFLIHNSKDPHGSVDDLNGLVRDIRLEVILKEAENHDYLYPEDVLSILKSKMV